MRRLASETPRCGWVCEATADNCKVASALRHDLPNKVLPPLALLCSYPSALAGVLFKKGWLRRTRASLAVFGVFTAVIIYGGIMNPVAAMMTSSESLKWEALIACYITGLPMDLVHGFGTLIFLMIAAEPMLEKMDRIKIKYGIAE